MINVLFPLYRWMTLLLLRHKLLIVISSQYPQVKINLLHIHCTWRELPFQICHLYFNLNEEIYHQLSYLQSKKACGPGKIPVYFLRRTAPLIAAILFLIFQSSLNQGTLPSDWKTVNIIPIYKKGNRSQPSNYRPASFFNFYLL